MSSAGVIIEFRNFSAIECDNLIILSDCRWWYANWFASLFMIVYTQQATAFEFWLTNSIDWFLITRRVFFTVFLCDWFICDTRVDCKLFECFWLELYHKLHDSHTWFTLLVEIISDRLLNDLISLAFTSEWNRLWRPSTSFRKAAVNGSENFVWRSSSDLRSMTLHVAKLCLQISYHISSILSLDLIRKNALRNYVQLKLLCRYEVAKIYSIKQASSIFLIRFFNSA